jgi:ATPase subunit of ABC transporter with duplicated ATPase domains
MADLDYGRLQVYPGNYDDFMLASTQARERTLANNAKKQAQIKDLQAFVARFKANKSKSRQATSRLKQIDKIQLDDIKPSSRQNPFIRFEFEKKLHRNAVELQSLNAGYDGERILANMDLIIEAGEKVAVIGPNGIGKSTFLKALVGDLEPMSGRVKWSENAGIGYFAQDHAHEFEGGEPLLEWMSQWGTSEDDEQVIRGILGRLLFSRDEIHKPCNVISGGEEGRMLFGKLMLGRHNVLVMDEPTNHLDMESIESLNYALELFEGTLIFVSHDREFVSSLATRVIELKEDDFVDYKGGYEDYLASQGIE